MSNVNATLTMGIVGSEQKTIGTTPESVQYQSSIQQPFTNGTGPNQVDLVYPPTQRTLVAASENLDLNGVLTSLLNDSIVMLKVRTITIKNLSTTAGAFLLVGGAATNPFLTPFGSATDRIKIGPGGVFVISSPIDGYIVTPSTGDLLKVDAGANTITYEITVAGTSV